MSRLEGDTIAFGNGQVASLDQLREQLLFVAVGDAALKLKHCSNRVEQRVLLCRPQLLEPVCDVLDQFRICGTRLGLLDPLVRVLLLFFLSSQLNQ